ncbi:Methyltransferase [Durusdinium trenchii]|uniref:Methyltransferase n=1 Tax=Durusdinium trenchii TaxID=1381693 RepID=A0ABP0Q3P8_9DINO
MEAATEALCLDQVIDEDFALYHGDCCELIRGVPDESIGFTVFSPPFASLYTYSDSERDMGNCGSDEEFWEHFRYLIPELLRVTMPGRLCSVHCMNLPSTIAHNGYIGIRDFRGDVIRAFQDAGWIYHSEVCIWKDPVTAMQRTKALGLLHKQLVKDSCMSRQGIPDYVCTFRKPGKNPEPVCGELDYFCGESGTFQQSGRLSIDVWQRYASPVWMDIDMSNTLNGRAGREEKDERHICPLQLDVIERCLQLWSNPGDTILSPYAGIGSEGLVSIEKERRFLGFELKESYFSEAAKVSNVFELHDAPDGDLVEEAFGGAEFWLERLDIVAVEIRDADGEWRIFGDKFDRWLLSFGRDSVRSRVANRITLHLSVNHEFDHGDIAKRDYTWNQPE